MLVVDGRNALDAQAVAAAGLAYEGIGRTPIAAPGEGYMGPERRAE